MLADVVRLQRLLGCRPSESLSIRAGMIVQNADVWEIPLSQHKNASKGKSRVQYCGPKAQRIPAEYLDGCRDDELLFSSKKSE
jgi:hypothetical protein